MARAMPRPGVPVQLATTTAPAPPGNASLIGKEELEEARAVLNRARDELAPNQWALLDSKLTEAERAFEHFNTVASASGKVALVGRGAEQLSKAGRTVEIIEGIEKLAHAGPALALLILLWPSETAGPEYDHGPDWVPPEESFKAKLREVSKAAQQVRSELAAAHRDAPSGTREQSMLNLPDRDWDEAVKRQARDKSPATKPKPPEVKIPDENWNPEPGQDWDGPCTPKGSGGPGQFRPPRAPKDWVYCRYQCGRYQIEIFDVLGKSGKDCTNRENLERAERLAKRAHRQLGRGL